MEARKMFQKIELIIEKKEEAEVLWAFIAASSGNIGKFLKDAHPKLTTRERDELIDATDDMFSELDGCFRPEWYKEDC